MSDFLIYLKLGFRHIIDIYGADHILFIFALTIRYLLQDWKKVLILVTAFTIGHSITLALSTIEWVDFPSQIIELLIPITILITAISNFAVHQNSTPKRYPVIYFLAMGFGLIHGLGFSNYLKSLLGKEESVLGPLFAFNLGLELGQLLIVSIILGISFIFVTRFKVDRLLYTKMGSLLVMLFALNMIWDRLQTFIH